MCIIDFILWQLLFTGVKIYFHGNLYINLYASRLIWKVRFNIIGVGATKYTYKLLVCNYQFKCIACKTKSCHKNRIYNASSNLYVYLAISLLISKLKFTHKMLPVSNIFKIYTNMI